VKLSCLVIVLFSVTFTWKLVADRPALHTAEGRIVQFLTGQRFDVSKQAVVNGLPIVRAIRDDCRMLVAEAFPDGSMRDAMRHLATTMERPFVVFRGSIYDEQPTWFTATWDGLTRFLRRLGISHVEAPPILVAATHSCEARQLPWAELSSSG